MNASPVDQRQERSRRRKLAAQSIVRAALAFAFWLSLLTVALAQDQGQPTPPAADKTAAQSATPSSASSAPAAAAPVPETNNAAEITTRQDSDTTFKVSVNLVVVRVVVRDSQGRAVGALKKEDFQLLDNGKPQVIARFAMEQTANSLPAGGSGANGQTGAKVQVPERYVAYLFDDIHLTAADVDQSRNAAIDHLDHLASSDRAAVYTTSGQTMLDFTDDRVKLRDTLMHIKPSPISNSTAMNCPDVSFYLADRIINKHDGHAMNIAVQDAYDCMHLARGPSPSAQEISQAQQIVQSAADQVLTRGTEQTNLALGTLRDVIRRTAAMPGERTVVLVSPGFILADTLQTVTQIIDRALRSKVIVSTLDARGLYTTNPAGDISQARTPGPLTTTDFNQYALQSASAQADVLAELAYGTGGTFFHNNNNLQEGFRRTTEAPEFYYVLGFAPQNLKNDGAYHSLKVTLKEKQPYSLQARKGYYAPKHSESVAEQAKSDINDAVFSQEERKDMPVELQTKFFKTSGDAAKLAVLVKVDVRHLRYRKVDGRNRNDLTIVSALFDRNGNFIQGDQKTLQMRLTDETLEKKLSSGVTLRANFDVKPGSYLVRCVVRDNDGELSSANDSVEIP